MTRPERTTIQGPPCGKCGSTERYTHSGRCAACARSYHRRNVQAKRDAWGGSAHDASRLAKAIWIAEHPGASYARTSKEWLDKNPAYKKVVREHRRRMKSVT